MSFTDILSKIPGVNKINIKLAIEGISYRVIKHVNHKVEKYVMSIDFKTKFAEFIVYHPGPNVPPYYRNPQNQTFKGKQRNIPDNTRLYDMELSSGIDMIEGILKMQIPDFKGEVDLIILYIDRNAREIPVEILYENNGKKSKLKHVLK